MKFFVCTGLFLLTAMLLGSAFYLALVGMAYWGWFLGLGFFAFLISSGVSHSLAEGECECDDESVEMGD